jgi:hypothetical protein
MACMALGCLLVACSAGVGSIPGVFTTGGIRVLGLEPDIRECLVRPGISLGVMGESFGPAEAWASGENRVIFPPNPPGIVSDRVQLVGHTLFVLVPAGVASGTLLIDAGTYGTAEVEITVDGGGTAGLRALMVGTICVSNPAPAP